MASESRDNVSKINDLLRTIAAVLVPIIVAWLGYSYTSAISNRETAVRFVELAIDILQENPVEGEREPLREWAIEVVNQNSVVKLSEEAKTILIEKRALLDHGFYTRKNVAAVQKFLTDGGWGGERGIFADGFVGPETIRALQKYQSSKDIEPTGEIDANTKRALTEDGVEFDR